MIKGSKHSKESCRRISENHADMKGVNNPMFGKHFFHSEERKKKLSLAWRGVNNPMFGKHFSEEHKKKLSLAKSGEKHFMFGKHHSEETKKKISEWHISNPNRKFKDTSIESSIEKELINREIQYVKQYPLCKTAIVDFYIPGTNTVIQCDGCYYHNCPLHHPLKYIGAAEKRIKQDQVLISNGYKVFHFWEHEINESAAKCVDQVINK